MKRIANILLIIGVVVLIAGAVLSVCDVEPAANYVLIAGAALVIVRSILTMHK